MYKRKDITFYTAERQGGEFVKQQKMTWPELEAYLKEHSDRKGVIVFKQGKDWKKENYTLEERSYEVSGNNKWFKPYALGNSLFGYSLDGKENGVRLDWYMYSIPEDGLGERWIVDYCYLLEEGE
jgi:hypothetical protein